MNGIFGLFLNYFIEIYYIYYVNHPFKVKNSMGFNVDPDKENTCWERLLVANWAQIKKKKSHC